MNNVTGKQKPQLRGIGSNSLAKGGGDVYSSRCSDYGHIIYFSIYPCQDQLPYFLPAVFTMPSKMISQMIVMLSIYCFCHKRANTAYWPTDTNDADSKSVLALS